MKKSAAIEATVIAIGAALLLVSAAAAAETFRWVDAEGEVHYSDRPVEGSKEVQIKTADVGEPSQAPAQDAAAAVRAKHCGLARERLKMYETSDRLLQEDEFGRESEIKGEARVQLIVRAQADVKSFCVDQPEVATAAPVAETATEAEEVETETEAAGSQESSIPEASAGY